MFNGQSEQDKFVLRVLNEKKNGFFVEIGSNDPRCINNSFILEKTYNWRGIMVEYDPSFLPFYKKERASSIHIIQDATVVDYKKAFEENNVPVFIDYLQIDLEEHNGSTLNTLKNLDKNVLDMYKFATVTFEHDIYRSNAYDTRLQSRTIFDKRGYVRVFEDVSNEDLPYEDWYVHPDLVDMNYINKLIQGNAKNYKHSDITGKMLSWKAIQY